MVGEPLPVQSMRILCPGQQVDLTGRRVAKIIERNRVESAANAGITT